MRLKLSATLPVMRASFHFPLEDSSLLCDKRMTMNIQQTVGVYMSLTITENSNAGMVKNNKGQQHGITAVIIKSAAESVMKLSGSLAERFAVTKFRGCCSASSYNTYMHYGNKYMDNYTVSRVIKQL